MWAPDIPVAEPHMALRHFSLVFGGFGAFLYFLYKFAPEPPVVPRAIVSHEAGNGRVPTEVRSVLILALKLSHHGAGYYRHRWTWYGRK